MGTILNLPCLRGNIGDWTYFCTVMKIRDIVKRVITVSESSELYTSNINEILQREINEKRISQIKDYIINNPEHFFSSIIAAIHRGNPIWSDFDIESHFRIENETLSEKEIEFIENKIGILSLSGGEVIFALDGQHRLKGLKEAYLQNENIGDEEISIILVVHSETNKQRTRRLFTVLNKYAQKPKEAELIILDEDDTSAIITRKLADRHYVLSKPHAISNTNGSNIPANDTKCFTTIVTINRINQLILKYFYKIDFTKRPSQENIDLYYIKCEAFWDFLFEKNPWIEEILNGQDIEFENGEAYRRNNITGGNLLLRPVGQKIFAQIYLESINHFDLPTLSKKLQQVDFNLNGPLCKYISWYDKMLPKSEHLQKRIFFHILGLSKDEKLLDDVRNEYLKYGVTLDSSSLFISH